MPQDAPDGNWWYYESRGSLHFFVDMSYARTMVDHPAGSINFKVSWRKLIVSMRRCRAEARKLRGAK